MNYPTFANGKLIDADATLNRTTVVARLENALATAETAYAAWPDLTAAQKDAAMRQAVRAIAGLIRLELAEFGSAGP
jgi:hypothetical protein